MSARPPLAPRYRRMLLLLASHHCPPWHVPWRPLAWVGGGILALLGGILALAAGGTTLTLVNSLAGTPIIHWDSGMIYAGQNHDLPWGPVGMLVTVDGAQFSPGQQVSVAVAPGNSNQSPTACASSPVTVGNGTADDQGAFIVAFTWPEDAAQINNAYSVCSFAGPTGGVLSTQNDGPFTVLASAAPILRLTPRSIAPGGTVTITGSNWVPPQPVDVAITAGGGRPPLVTGTATSTGQNTGVFSIKLKIPEDAPAGTYGIDASAKDGRLSAAAPGVLAITALTPTVTPTPTHTPTVAPTHTPAVTPTTAPTLAPTAAPTAAPVTPATTSSSEPNWAIIGLAIATGLLLLTSAVLLGLLLSRRHDHDDGVPPAAPWPVPGQQQPPRAAVPVPPGQAAADPHYNPQYDPHAPRYQESAGWRPFDPNQPGAREGYPPAEYPPQQSAAPEAWPPREPYQNPASGPYAGPNAGPYQGPYSGPYSEPYQGRPPAGQQAPEGWPPAGQPPAREDAGYGPPYGPYSPRPPSQPSDPYRVSAPGGEPRGEPQAPPPDAYGMPGPWRFDPDSQPRESPFSGPIQGGPPPWAPQQPAPQQSPSPPQQPSWQQQQQQQQQPPPQWHPEDQPPPPVAPRPVPHGPYDPNEW